MRWNALLPGLVVLLAPLLAGCVGEDGDAKDPEAAEDDGADERSDGAPTTNGRLEINAPRARPGLMLVYKLDGPWALQNRANIVITEHEGATLFAGKTQDDLKLEILEGSFLFGPRSADLNELDDSGAERERVFDFPLWDGKTWTSGETSYRATFAGTTLGSEVTITGDGPDRTTTYVYDPAIGFVAQMKVVHKERGELWSATFDHTDFADEWVWFHYDSWGVAGLGDEDVTSATVSAAADHVFYESYGDFGTRAIGISPSAKYEPFEGFGPERPVTRKVAAEAGDWRLSTVAQPGQSQTLWLVAVTWIVPAA